MATLYKPVYAKFLTAYRGVHRGTERLSSHSLEAAVRTEGNPSTPTPGPLRALQGGQGAHEPQSHATTESHTTVLALPTTHSFQTLVTTTS